jgi:hypothetical protein
MVLAAKRLQVLDPEYDHGKQHEEGLGRRHYRYGYKTDRYKRPSNRHKLVLRAALLRVRSQAAKAHPEFSLEPASRPLSRYRHYGRRRDQ